MSNDHPEITDIGEFLLNWPLYKVGRLPDSSFDWEFLYGRGEGRAKFDGHCPMCHRSTTFTLSPIHWSGVLIEDARKRNTHPFVSIRCARYDGHEVRFNLRQQKSLFQKIGQFPSLADIANDEAVEFRNQLVPDDAADFHRAVGLAAHGVGIGSFVYLRRVFERLVNRRFDAHENAEGWTEDDRRLPISDKIKLMKKYLPAFMVKNRKAYGILSLGIHELKEEQCLGMFDVLKASIVRILTEDKQRADEEAETAEIEKKIAEFTAKGANEGKTDSANVVASESNCNTPKLG